MNAFFHFEQPQLAAVVERLGWVLVHSLWQFALIALLAGIAARAMRRNTAALRYGMLLVAMAALIAAPVVTCLLQPPVLPDHQASRSASATGFVPSAPADLNPASPLPNNPLLVSDSEPESPAAQLASATDDSVAPPAVVPPAPVSAEPALPWSERFTAVLRPWLAWIVAAWSLGVALCSLRPLLGWRTLRRLQRVGVSPASEDILTALARVSARLGLARAVRVMQSTLVRVPVVVGYLRPVILLPVSLVTTIPAGQLDAILAHELAHIGRHDFLVNLLQMLVETLFFYHPAVWWLSQQIRLEREHCCDDLVVRLLDNRVEYGRALVAIEQLRGENSILALGASDGSLLARVRRIVGGGSGGFSGAAPRQSIRWPVLFLGATCALLALIALRLGMEAGADQSNPLARVTSGNETERLPPASPILEEEFWSIKSEAAWPLIGRMRTLERVRFVASDLRGHLPELAQLQRLREFHVVNSQFEFDDLADLVHFPNLEMIDVMFSVYEATDDELAARLGDLSADEQRWFDDWRSSHPANPATGRIALLTDRALLRLSGLSKLKTLKLSNTDMSDRGLAALTYMPQLEEIEVSCVKLDVKAGRELARHPRLRSFRSASVTGDVLTELAQLTNLEQLSLWGKEVTDAGVKSLSKCTKLRELTFRGSDITDIGLDALSQLPDLRLLELEYGAEKVTPAGAARFREQNPNCRLVLSETPVGRGSHDAAPRETLQLPIKDSGGPPALNGLRTRMTLLTERPAVGLPLKFKIELQNVGPLERTYESRRANPDYSMEIIGPDGRPAELINGPSQVQVGSAKIKPGETVPLYAELDVASMFLLSRPGGYTVTLRGVDKFDAGDSDPPRVHPIPTSNTISLTLAAGPLNDLQATFVRVRDIMPKDWKLSHGRDSIIGIPPDFKKGDSRRGILHLRFLAEQRTDEQKRLDLVPYDYLGKTTLGHAYLTLPAGIDSDWPRCMEQIREQLPREVAAQAKRPPDNVQPWGQELNGLRTRLVSLTEQPAVGRPLKVRIELQNSGTFERTYHTQKANPDYLLDVVDPDGKPAEFINGGSGIRVQSLKIKPGETVVLFDDVDVASMFLLAKPGRYAITLRGPATFDVDGARPEQAHPYPTSNTLAATLADGNLNEIQATFVRIRNVAPKDSGFSTRGTSISNITKSVSKRGGIHLFFSADLQADDLKLGITPYEYLGETLLGHAYLAVLPETRSEWPDCVEKIRAQLPARIQNPGDADSPDRAEPGLQPAAVGQAPEVGPGQRLELVQWSHDSKQVFAAGDFNKLTLWEHQESGWAATSLEAQHHANSIAASRKSPLIVAGTNVGTAEVWDASTRKRQGELRSSPQYSVYAVAISADDRLVAACGTDGTVAVFDRAAQQLIARLGEKADTRMSSLAFSPDGKSLAALDRYGHLVLWNLDRPTRLAEWKGIAGGEYCSVQWSADGKQLAASGPGRVTLISAEKGSQPIVVMAPEAVLSRHPKEDDSVPRSGPFPGGISFASLTAISPDVRTAASIAPDGSIGIWDLASRKIVVTLPAPAESVIVEDSAGKGLRNLAFSPDGRHLGCTTVRGDIIFWQVPTILAVRRGSPDSAQAATDGLPKEGSGPGERTERTGDLRSDGRRGNEAPAEQPEPKSTRAAGDILELARRFSPSIVAISKTDPETGLPDPNPNGCAGVIVDSRGYILTMLWATERGGKQLRVRLNDQHEYLADVVATDASLKLAVLQIQARWPLPAVSLSKVRDPQAGDLVVAIPSPGQKEAKTGIVTGLGKDLGEKFPKNLIQSDLPLAITEGASLMVSDTGEPLGIWVGVRAGKTRASFAIPLTDALSFLKEALPPPAADGPGSVGRERPPVGRGSPAPAPGATEGLPKAGPDATKAGALRSDDRRGQETRAEQRQPRLGTLTGRFVYDGEPPIPVELFSQLAKLDANSPLEPRPEGAGIGMEEVYRDYLKHGIRPKLTSDSLLIGADRGIANVLIWVTSKNIPWSPPEGGLPPATITLKDGNFSPRIATVVVGQPLVVENLDPVEFDFAVEFWKALNAPVKSQLRPGIGAAPLRLAVRVPEPFPAGYSSRICPWTGGSLFVHRNSYFAVSRADGSFTLPNLPPGEWEFHVWHERAGYVSAWPKGLFIKAIVAGENSLGTIRLKPEQLGQIPPASAAPPPKNREQVGEVLGKPVYRDQVPAGELDELFFVPVRKKYHDAHEAEMNPTADELKYAAAYFDSEHKKRLEAEGGEAVLRSRLEAIEVQLSKGGLSEEAEQTLEQEHRNLKTRLEPSGKLMAAWALTNWKGEKHIYDHFGGGRVLVGKFGHTAFDANRVWRETLEKQGEFQITDPALRARFYERWKRDRGNFLKSDQEEIRRLLLEPEYVAPRATKD